MKTYLVDQNSALGNRVVEWLGRLATLFAMSSRLMRRVFVDAARDREYQKRGGELERGSLHEELAQAEERSADVLALDAALEKLAAIDSRKMSGRRDAILRRPQPKKPQKRFMVLSAR